MTVCSALGLRCISITLLSRTVIKGLLGTSPATNTKMCKNIFIVFNDAVMSTSIRAKSSFSRPAVVKVVDQLELSNHLLHRNYNLLYFNVTIIFQCQLMS